MFNKELVSENAAIFSYLGQEAYRQYEPIVKDLCIRQAAQDEVEWLLERMLDFCDFEDVLGLFKRLCQHYYDIYPEMIADEIRWYKKEYLEEQ